MTEALKFEGKISETREVIVDSYELAPGFLNTKAGVTMKGLEPESIDIEEA